MLTPKPKHVKIVQTEPSRPTDPKRLKEAISQFIGQADRTNNMYAELLIDLTERVEKLEGFSLVSNHQNTQQEP